MADERLFRWRQFTEASTHWLGLRRAAPDVEAGMELVFVTGSMPVARSLMDWPTATGPENGPSWRTVFTLPLDEIGALRERIPAAWTTSAMRTGPAAEMLARFRIPVFEGAVEEVRGASAAVLLVDAAGRRWVETDAVARPPGFGPVPELLLPPEWTLRVTTPGDWAQNGRMIVQQTLAGTRPWTLDDIHQRGRLMAEAPGTPVPAGSVLPDVPADGSAEERRQALEARGLAGGELLRTEALRAASRHLANADFNAARRLERLLEFGAANDTPPVMAWAIRSVLSEDGGLARATAFRPGAGTTAPSLVSLSLGPGRRDVEPSDDNSTDHRFLDLRHLDPPTAEETATAELELRAAAGTAGNMILMLPGRAEGNAAFRNNLARGRGIEATLDIPPGFGGLAPATLIAVGEVRPEVLEAAPPPALRVIEAARVHDVHQWRAETLRQRSAISRWHDGEQAEALVSRPYAPISRVGQSSTMVPEQLADPTRAAGAALAESLPDGNVDTWVAEALGLDPEQDREEFERRFQAEQIDALALAAAAWRQGRGFLLADQTGVGKGRSLAGAAAVWLRQSPDHRVLYVTAGSGNMADVVRDMEATGCLDEPGPPPVMLANEVQLREGQPGILLSDAERRAVMASEAWPTPAVSREPGEEAAEPRIVCTTYSSFAQDEEALEVQGRDWPNRRWLDEVSNDPNLLLVMDECHRALNPQSWTGQAFRQAAGEAGAVMFASATPLRDHRGIDLYTRLLPPGVRIPRMSEAVSQTMLEAVSALLVEDGVMLRRDHDYSDVEFSTSVPNPGTEEERQAREAIEGLRPVVRAMLAVHAAVRDAVRVNAAGVARVPVPEGMFAAHFGGPLTAVSNAVMMGLKVETAARLAAEELDAGRKPMISITTTGGAFLDHAWERQRAAEAEQAEDGADPVMEPPGPPDIRDVIRRIAERLYLQVDEDGELIDIRHQDERVAELAETLEQRIQAFPIPLPASPIDAMKARIGELTGRGADSVGEVTGRRLALAGDGSVVQRDPSQRLATIDAYNAGELDCLIYNAAGGVGFSYHSSEEFADQRPRSILQLEPTLDAVEFIQGLGRGNRYGQVAPPRIVSVGSGLVPETRLMGLLSRKLRSLGAAVDSDRHHPLLNPNYPDLINSVGDRAALSILRRDPRFAEALGLGDRLAAVWRRHPAFHPDRGRDLPHNPPSDAVVGWAARALGRSVLLPDDEQRRLLDEISDEFDVTLAALDEQGMNPLEVRRLEGHFVPAGPPQMLHPDQGETEAASSVFQRPLMVVTGHQHASRGVLRGEQVVASAEETRRLMPPDRSPAAWAARLQAVAPMQAELFTADATEGDRQEGERLSATTLLELLEPGTALERDGSKELVLDFFPPEDGIRSGQLRGFDVLTIRPGDPHPSRVGLRALVSAQQNGRLTVGENVLDGNPASYIESWNTDAEAARRRPVQLVTGNVFGVLGLHENLRSEDQERRRGRPGARRARIGLWSVTQEDGLRQRAMVNLTPALADLAAHPFPVGPEAWLRGGRLWARDPAAVEQRAAVARELIVRDQRGGNRAGRRVTPRWDMKVLSGGPGRRQVARMTCAITAATGDAPARMKVARPRGRAMTKNEWEQWQRWPGPAVWKLLTGNDMPEEKPLRAFAQRTWPLDDPRSDRLVQLMERHPWMAQGFMPGEHRRWVTENAARIAVRPDRHVVDYGDAAGATQALAALIEKQDVIGVPGSATDLLHAYDRQGRQVRLTLMGQEAGAEDGTGPTLMLFASDPDNALSPEVPGSGELEAELAGGPVNPDTAGRIARDLTAAGYTISIHGDRPPEPAQVHAAEREQAPAAASMAAC